MDYIPEVGDIVTVRDGSYSYKLNSTTPHYSGFGMCRDMFVVEAINGAYPMRDGPREGRPHNDTLVKNLSNGEHWYCIAKICLVLQSRPTSSSKSLNFKTVKKFKL